MGPANSLPGNCCNSIQPEESVSMSLCLLQCCLCRGQPCSLGPISSHLACVLVSWLALGLELSVGRWAAGPGHMGLMAPVFIAMLADVQVHGHDVHHPEGLCSGLVMAEAGFSHSGLSWGVPKLCFPGGHTGQNAESHHWPAPEPSRMQPGHFYA